MEIILLKGNKATGNISLKPCSNAIQQSLYIHLSCIKLHLTLVDYTRNTSFGEYFLAFFSILFLYVHFLFLIHTTIIPFKEPSNDHACTSQQLLSRILCFLHFAVGSCCKLQSAMVFPIFNKENNLWKGQSNDQLGTI